jgi:hypothetical protein
MHLTDSTLRCPRFARALVLGVIAAGFAALAPAQVQRVFPQTALRGELVITHPPEAMLNGNPVRLAPGARIRDARNAQVLSGTLVGAPLLVHYTVDPVGLVHDVWILRPEEAAKRPWPTTRREAAEWRFDPAAQVWSKP